LEPLSLVSDGNAPANRRTVLTAEAGADRPRFVAQIRTLLTEPATGILRWKFRDWDGNERGAGERQITTLKPGEPLAAEIQGPAVTPGLKFLEAEIALEIPGQDVPAVKPCWVAQPEPQRDARLTPESPFGMGIYLGRYQGADMDRVAETARDAGVKWSREGFSWSRIEPSKGRFQWDYYDRLVATAKRNGISIYALLSGWAGWTKSYTEEGVDDYVAYARQLVRRYKNDIHHWEIWNEPNIFFWDGPKELYATMLVKSYAAIKEEDPTAQVLGMSTSGIDYNFIARMMARGGPYDALTIHPYRRVLDDQVFINELKVVSQLAGGKPVWITEMGWSVHTPHNTLNQDFTPNSLRIQAEMIARTYLCTLVSGVHPNTSWYDFRNDGEDPIYFEHNMGIMYRDYRPKPAFVAFATMTRVLKDLRLAGKVEAGAGVFAYRFEGPRKVIVMWSPTADATAKLPSAAKGEIVNAVGETRQFSGTEVRLKAGAPVYLVLGD
jgi:GH35 family endo-1,4-beta-xylanase